MATANNNQGKAICLIVFVVALLLSDSSAKTVASTKKLCNKKPNGQKNHMASTMKPTVDLTTTLPTTLPPTTKTPCTKKHIHGNENKTTTSSTRASLPTKNSHIYTKPNPTTHAPTTACRPLNCVVSEWSEWQPCSASCGIAGRKLRYRKINTLQSCGGVCPYRLNEASPCNNAVCLNGGTVFKMGCKCRAGYDGVCCEKVNGIWSTWGRWSWCSKSCDIGIQRRTRTCDHPAPSNGGLDCAGPSTETVDCNVHECPVNGGWSAWGDWSSCSSSCGEGRKFRQRQCNNPFPSKGGLPCTGLMLLTAKCQLEECKTPVDGGWSAWLEWSQCSKTCGLGSRLRTRVCNNPLPTDGGKSCPGSNHEEEKCFKVKCKIPGNGGGGGEGGFGKRHAKHHAATRHGENPLSSKRSSRRLLSYENNDIIPDFDVYVLKHNEESIRRDDKTTITGPWTSWSTCSTTCGAGQRFRTRACSELANPCIGVPMDVGPCNMGKCNP